MYVPKFENFHVKKVGIRPDGKKVDSGNYSISNAI